MTKFGEEATVTLPSGSFLFLPVFDPSALPYGTTGASCDGNTIWHFSPASLGTQLALSLRMRPAVRALSYSHVQTNLTCAERKAITAINSQRCPALTSFSQPRRRTSLSPPHVSRVRLLITSPLYVTLSLYVGPTSSED